jgi:tetraacyldisaccharide 4'-kinase
VADAAPASTPASGWAARLQTAWLSRGGLACCLLPLAALFGALAALQRGLYRSGVLRVHRLPVPVIVVGNLVAGGAGKTPTTLALVKALQRRGYTPGIVSRGYGRKAEGLVEVLPDTPVRDSGDEPLLLRLRARVPVVVGRDRVAAGRELLRRHPAIDVLVSDDGLQHHRLARDLQLLVFDERGVGNAWLLPAGPLREPLRAAPPPASLVLYNAVAASTPWPGFVLRRALTGVSLLADWWHGEAPSPAALAALRDRPLWAVAGLARPERFFEMLRAQGLRPQTLALPDHADFTNLPWPSDTRDVIVTEKDAVKLQATRVGATRVWVATLDFRFDAGFESALDAALHQHLPPPRRRATSPANDDHGNTPA